MAHTQAYAYLRVSSKGQAKDSRDGFPRQRAAVDTFGGKAKLAIVGEYRDALSGTRDADHRPGFEAMVADMLTNGVRTVVVERLDRLARAYALQEELAMYLAGHGIALWSADTEENITAALLGDPMKKALVQMRGVFAELDKNMLVVKLAKARQRKRQETGRCEGVKPYGMLPGEADTLARMRELYRKPRNRPRRSYGAIARILDQEGRKPRKAAAWSRMAVRNILNRKATP